MPTVTVDVDVELDDFDVDDLIKEVGRRGKVVTVSGSDEFWIEAANLLRTGRKDEALERLRTELQDRLGCILP